MPHNDTEPKSKSQKKREHQALQDLAESLVELTTGQRETIPLSDPLREGVIQAANMKKGALRRQIRHLAQLLSKEDAEDVRLAVERVHHGSREDTARLHRVERWRDQLIEDESAALPAFIDAHPGADRRQLRQLIRSARKERERNVPPRAFRRLFALIRELEP